MKTILSIIQSSLFLLFFCNCNAQYYFYGNLHYAGSIVVEGGVSIGAMNCFTDLGGNKGTGKKFIKDFNFVETKPSAGFYLTATYRDVIAIKLDFNHGSIAASDRILKNKDEDLIGRYGRNLSFKSSINDVQLAMELHPLFLWSYDEGKAPYLSPYLIAGIGAFKFNPKAKLQSKWYELHGLHLEGQGFEEYPSIKPYQRVQLNIPFGIGIRYEASDYVNIRIELIQRKLFTDYLDDVSNEYIDPKLFAKHLSAAKATIANQLYSRMYDVDASLSPAIGQERGNPRNKDSYFTVQIKLGFIFRKK